MISEKPNFGWSAVNEYNAPVIVAGNPPDTGSLVPPLFSPYSFILLDDITPLNQGDYLIEIPINISGHRLKAYPQVIPPEGGYAIEAFMAEAPSTTMLKIQLGAEIPGAGYFLSYVVMGSPVSS